MNDNGRVPPDSPQWTGQVLKRSVTGPNKNYMVNPTYLSNPEKEGSNLSKDVDDTLMVPVMMLGLREPQDNEDVIVHCVGNRFVSQLRKSGAKLTINATLCNFTLPLVGATITIKQGSTLIESFVTDGTPHVTNLPPGDYTATGSYNRNGTLPTRPLPSWTFTMGTVDYGFALSFSSYHGQFDQLWTCCNSSWIPLPTVLYLTDSHGTIPLTSANGSEWFGCYTKTFDQVCSPNNPFSTTGDILAPGEAVVWYRFSCTGQDVTQDWGTYQLLQQMAYTSGCGVMLPTATVGTNGATGITCANWGYGPCLGGYGFSNITLNPSVPINVNVTFPDTFDTITCQSGGGFGGNVTYTFIPGPWSMPTPGPVTITE